MVFLKLSKTQICTKKQNQNSFGSFSNMNLRDSGKSFMAFGKEENFYVHKQNKH